MVFLIFCLSNPTKQFCSEAPLFAISEQIQIINISEECQIIDISEQFQIVNILQQFQIIETSHHALNIVLRRASCMLCFICSIELSVAGTSIGAPLAASLEVLQP